MYLKAPGLHSQWIYNERTETIALQVSLQRPYCFRMYSSCHAFGFQRYFRVPHMVQGRHSAYERLMIEYQVCTVAHRGYTASFHVEWKLEYVPRQPTCLLKYRARDLKTPTVTQSQEPNSSSKRGIPVTKTYHLLSLFLSETI